MTAVTAVTVQNSLRVSGVAEIPADIVAAQILTVAEDIGVQAAKTGMLANAEIIKAVAKACDRVGIGQGGEIPFVVDPVAASMHGDPLLHKDAMQAIVGELFPRATLVTPNLDEVKLFTGIEVRTYEEQRAAAEALIKLGARWALVKGGHMREDPRCVDLLFDGTTFIELPAPREDTRHTHGGGDTMASSITAGLARGMDLPSAVRFGKWFVTRAVRHAYPLGAGVGPVSAFWRLAEEDPEESSRAYP